MQSAKTSKHINLTTKVVQLNMLKLVYPGISLLNYTNGCFDSHYLINKQTNKQNYFFLIQRIKWYDSLVLIKFCYKNLKNKTFILVKNHISAKDKSQRDILDKIYIFPWYIEKILYYTVTIKQQCSLVIPW